MNYRVLWTAPVVALIASTACTSEHGVNALDAAGATSTSASSTSGAGGQGGAGGAGGQGGHAAGSGGQGGSGAAGGGGQGGAGGLGGAGGQGGGGGGGALPSPYPVDPQDHVDDKTKDALDSTTYQPVVLNKDAYARYAINGMRIPAAPLGDDVAALRAELAAIAQASGISPAEALQMYAHTASSAEIEALRQAILSEAHGIDPATFALATAGQRLVETISQVTACTAAISGPDAVERCCRALAFPTFLIAQWSDLSAADQAALTDAASDPGFFAAFVATSPAPEFRLQGIKAWVGACDATVLRAPPTLSALIAVHGDFHDGTWQEELHPVSRAKLAGRRIYRKGDVSIAESLDADCSVRETEVVLLRADGQRSFLTYSAQGDLAPYGYFPAVNRLDVDTVKFTPDSCMGCHYTFDTRQFKIRYPSFRALNLTLPSAPDGTPYWRDASSCQHPGESLILHVD